MSIDDIFDEAVLVVDPGSREWRVGFSDDDGPAVVLPCPPAVVDGEAAWKRQLGEAVSAALEERESESSEHAVVLAERPGTSAATRTAMAAALFALPVPALWVAPAPHLALFNSGRDTAVVVDVGERATYILLVYEGHAVLDAAAAHPLGGAHLPESGASASCDGLFEPAVLAGVGDESRGVPPTEATLGVHEAVLAVVSLADYSLRAPLLESVVLVGGGSMLPGFADRMGHELSNVLAAQKATYSVRCVANADRRIAPWMGAATACNVSSAQSCFVLASEYEHDLTELHTRCASLDLTLDST
jgi:actin-related protein